MPGGYVVTDEQAQADEKAQLQAYLSGLPKLGAAPMTDDLAAIRNNVSPENQQWVDYAYGQAQQEGLDPNIIVRQLNQESGFNPNAGSSAGAQGLGQFMPDTAQGLGINPWDPQQAIRGTVTLMKNYVQRYGGDYAKALAAYNAGPGAVDQAGGVPDYAETHAYIDAILGSGSAARPATSPAAPSLSQQASTTVQGAVGSLSTFLSGLKLGGTTPAPVPPPPSYNDMAGATSTYAGASTSGAATSYDSSPAQPNQPDSTALQFSMPPQVGDALNSGFQALAPIGQAGLDVLSAPSRIVRASVPNPTDSGSFLGNTLPGTLARNLSQGFSQTDPNAPLLSRINQGLTNATQPFESNVQAATNTIDQGDPTGGILGGAFSTGMHLGTDPLMYGAPLTRGMQVGTGVGALGGAAISRLTGASPQQTSQNVESGANVGMLGGAVVPEAVRAVRSLPEFLNGLVAKLGQAPVSSLVGDAGQTASRVLTSPSADHIRGFFHPAEADTADALAGAKAEYLRMYHGTGSAFTSPDALRFDPNGLFGPGYYLTSDARVANSYADAKRATPGANQNATLIPQIRKAKQDLADNQELLDRFPSLSISRTNPSIADEFRAKIAQAQQTISDLTARLTTEGGPNVRAVDVPAGLRLLDADAPIGQQPLSQLQATARSQGVPSFSDARRWDPLDAITPQSDGNAVHNRLTSAVMTDLNLPDAAAKAKVNDILQQAGFDGIQYAGGKRIPLNDAAGKPIEHTAVVVFPQSLPKLRNALSGTMGGLMASDAPASGGLSPLARSALGSGIRGSISGGYEASQEPDATPGSVAMGVGTGFVSGAARGLVGRQAGVMLNPEATGRAISGVQSLAAEAKPQRLTDALDEAKAGWVRVATLAKGLGLDIAGHEQYLPMELDTMEHAAGTAPAVHRSIELYNEYTGNVVNQALRRIRPQIEQLTTAIAGQKEAAYPELTRLAKGLLNDNGSMKETVPLRQWQNLTGDQRALAPNALEKRGGTVYVKPEYALDTIYNAGDESAAKFGKEFENLGDFQHALYQALQRDSAFKGQVAQLKDLTAKEQQLQAAYHAAIPQAHLIDNVTQAADRPNPMVGASGEALAQQPLNGIPPAPANQLTPPRALAGSQPKLPTPPVKPPVVSVPPMPQGSPVVRAINQIIAPARNTPEDVQAALRTFAGGRLESQTRAEALALEARRILGPNDNGKAASLYERTGQFVANPNPEQRALAAKVTQFMQDTGAQGRAAGYIKGDVTQSGAVANYFPHVYEDHLTPSTGQPRKGGVNPNDFYSKGRTIATLDDATQAGLTPVDSVSKVLQHYGGHVLDSEAKAQLVNALKTASPSAVVDMPVGAKVPDGWVSGMGITPQFAGVAFRGDVAQTIKNIINPSSLRKYSAVQGGLNTLGEAKQLLFSLTGFHQLTEMRQAISANGIKGVPVIARTLAHAVSPGAYENFRMSDQWRPVFDEAARNGVTGLAGEGVGKMAPDAEGFLSGPRGMAVRSAVGGVATGSSAYLNSKAHGDDDQTALLNGLKYGAAGALAGPLMKPVADSLWARQVPTLKVMTYGIQRAAGMDPQAAAAFVNNTYGGQNLAAIARSKGVQDALRVLTLAPDWWESWANQAGSAFRGGDTGRMSRAFWARTAAVSAFALEGLNYAFNGQFTDQNAPGHQFQLNLTGLYKHLGIDERNAKTGAPDETYMSILAAPVESLLNLSSPSTAGSFIKGKLGIVPRVAAEAMLNQDYRGQKIVPDFTPLPEAIAKQTANAIAQIAPIGGQQVGVSGINNEPAGVAALSTLTGLRTTHPSVAASEGPQLSSQSRSILDQSGAGWQPTPVSDQLHGIGLTPGERTAYQREVNTRTDQLLASISQSTAWQKMSAPQRKMLLEKLTPKIHEEAGAAILATIPKAEIAKRISLTRGLAGAGVR